VLATARLDQSGINLGTVGVILMVVGVVGLVTLARLLVELGRLRLAPSDDHHGRPRRRATSLTTTFGKIAGW
jgi:hypothetical protein